jgi:hypothetical protein
MLGCYGFLTKEQWEAKQDAFDATQREAWAANGAADLLPALERDQREFRQQWPERWARISALPSWRTDLAQIDRPRHIANRVERCLLSIAARSKWLGALLRRARTLRTHEQGQASLPNQQSMPLPAVQQSSKSDL